METGDVQLKWQFSYTEPNAFWSIDNITISSNSTMSISRREINNIELNNHHIHNRQSATACNIYYDNFDTGNYNRALWSRLSGGGVTMTPCGATMQSHYWLYFNGSGIRSVTTQLLNLEGFEVLTFNLIFRGCGGLHTGTRISLEYKIGNSNSWIQLRSFNSTCCYYSTQKSITLPLAIQTNSVQLRWWQQRDTLTSNSDGWAIDEVIIGNLSVNLVYQNNFNYGFNTSIWLSVGGGIISYSRYCGATSSVSLNFNGDYVRQAITQYLDFSQADSFSIDFYLRIGSNTEQCNNPEIGENVEISWRRVNGMWSLLHIFSSASYQDSQYVFLGLYDSFLVDSAQFRISQAVLTKQSFDIWSIDDFEIRLYNVSSCLLPVNPTPTPTQPPTPTMCNYYFDDFDDGSYKTSLWYTVSGIRILLTPCNLQLTYHYAMVLSSPGTRQLVTQLLDLRGVEYIKFYLLPTRENCISNHWDRNRKLSVAYSVAGNGLWYTLETYSTTTSVGDVIIFLPSTAQVNAVQLRWLDNSSTGRDIWILDNVQIGENVNGILYHDDFINIVNPSLWSSIFGGSVVTPSCGVVDVSTALFFSGDGIREAITQFLDMRQANAVSFALMTSSSSTCNGLDSEETIDLSIRTGYGRWMRLQSYSRVANAKFYVQIPESMREYMVQLRWRQTQSSIAGYDVWAIDTLKIHGSYPQTICSVACISDNFNSGIYNASIWNFISGAQVTTPPCNTRTSMKALYFNESSTRQAITQSLDLRGMYAISFYLQIVRFNEMCTSVGGDHVKVHYSSAGDNNWIEIGAFAGIRFVTETLVTIPLPLLARNQSVSIRISQPSYSTSVWSLGEFGIYSPDQCPSSSVTETTTILSPTPIHAPSTSLVCNYYWDNFDSGSYNTSLWSYFGGRVSRSNCQFPMRYRYHVLFSRTSEIVTHGLDLRGVESISFVLLSGSGSCNRRPIKDFYFYYKLGGSLSWNLLERFASICCISAKSIVISIPLSVQVPTVYLRWYYPYDSSDGVWILDDLRIGTSIETVLYNDEFTSVFDSSLWLLIAGGNVRIPSCGETYTDRALYFYGSGVREAVTKYLDLRDATSISFYLRIGSSDGTCEQADRNEDISLSYRLPNSSWKTIEIFLTSRFREASYVYIAINQSLQTNSVQFRFKQEVFAVANYDVWSIDNFIISSRGQDTKCSMACYSDNFNSGSYNSQLWSPIVIASVVVPPCSDNFYGKSLYFTDSGTREAVTNSLDLRGLYAITFTLQIGSFDNECDEAEAGDDIVLYYLKSGDSNWVELKSFNATAYTRATRVTVPIPHEIRVQGIALRWAQPQHSGLLQDTWYIDNIGIYSPDQCPPTAYQETKTTDISHSNYNDALTCNYYFDNFDDGYFKASIWDTISTATLSLSPCHLPVLLHYAVVLNNGGNLFTRLLDLRGVEHIRFYSKSCYPSSTNRYRNIRGYLRMYYKITDENAWYFLEQYDYTCCRSGRYVSVYLPVQVQSSSVQLRWNHYSYGNSYTWILDDIQIGESVDNTLYQDTFSNNLEITLWSSIFGGSVLTPSCGSIDAGTALFFSRDGTREAITQFLDLRQANAVSFYLMTSSSGSCDGLESKEAVELSFRYGYGEWIIMQTYSTIDSTYIYVQIPENMRKHMVQLRWRQTQRSIAGYDVWAIDSIKVLSSYPKTVCSVLCISDNFNSGIYNASIWSFIGGAQITTPPCNTRTSMKALYFNESSTRQAITQPLDLRGMYAISFYLQIVRFTEICTSVYTDYVRVHYSSAGDYNWIEIGAFVGASFLTETLVTIPLPLKARNQSVSIRISQPSYSTSVWSLGEFGIYSPDQCPSSSITETTTILSPTPIPVPSTSLVCNYYWDNFDGGSYKSSLWLSFLGVRILHTPCLPYIANQYGIGFFSPSGLSSQLVTQALNLQGVESISFYLISGSGNNGCILPRSSAGIYFSYRIGSTSSWNTLEYFLPSCCNGGRNITIYIPLTVQVSSVYLRWSKLYFTNTNSIEWGLYNVKIGTYIETNLYVDDFINDYNPSIWAIIVGASVTIPPCGETHSDNALYFFQGGKREAITKLLDLRDAKIISFYIRIGGSNCELVDSGEGIKLSYRIDYNPWALLQTYSTAGLSHVIIPVTKSLQLDGIQFRFKQKIFAVANYDVWSIDNFIITSREQDTKCSMACYSDNFNSGSYNSQLWSPIVIASVVVPPCSDNFYGKSLYFTDSGTREAVTNSLDLRGLYAITFTLQIGSFDNECDKAEAGDDVVLYYLKSGDSNWVELKSFNATAYTRATRVTVPIPHEIRVQGIALRWAQPQHSGLLQDTWYIDNIGIYSPDQCPPTAYQVTRPNPTFISFPNQNNILTCNYYFDNFDDGSYKPELISAAYVTLAYINLLPRQHYVVQGSLTTQLLDLRGVELVRFFLLSSSNSAMTLRYRIGSRSSTWYNIEYIQSSCCRNGAVVTVYLSEEVKVNSVQLTWSLPSDWVIDDVEIGSISDTILYEDLFTRNANATLWASISGGYVADPPCGMTDFGSALYFSRNGIREAVTSLLDLRSATSVSFYLQIGSSDSSCENTDITEDLEVSYKVGTSGWTLLQTFDATSYRIARYVHIYIPNESKVNGVQLRISQTILGVDSYDVWSIDTFTVHSVVQRPECLMACYMDNFNRTYNTSLWFMVSGGLVTPILCNINDWYYEGLYFNETGMRFAVTKSIDLSGLYAIKFSLQIMSDNDNCTETTVGEDVTLSYAVNNGTWSDFGRFSSVNYNQITDVTVELPLNARQPNVAIKICQLNFMHSVWAIDNFGIYSPDNCPPLNYAAVTTSMSPTPLPYPTPTASTVCNFYSDNFDSGLYKIGLWSTVVGVRITLQPCGLPYSLHYGMEFYSFGTRELTTDLLDLRGIEFLSFYLLSGSSSNGCSQPNRNGGIHVAYTIGSSAVYNNLEYYEPSCCSTGAYFRIHLPSAAQTTSVKIRWYQSTHTALESAEVWILDDVKIGISINDHFYEDYFTDSADDAIWESIIGANIVIPPCGVTHSGNALYFSANGTRQAITQQLDLRHATGLSFYLRIGSRNGRCENDNAVAAITLSWKVNFGMWLQLGSYEYYRDSRYIYISLTDNMKVNGVQFQILQSTTPSANEDVWSIDDFIVHSMHKDTLCTLACYSDDFNNGQYSPSLWSTVDGATVTIPACSNQYLGNALYFKGDGIRQAITRPIDIRGFYAVSFYLHIGSFSGSCEQAESGEHVNLHYQLANSTNWILLNSYGTNDFIRETRITEVLQRDIQQVGVTFRWMQASHSGALDDTWSLDNVGFHSPDECPPIAYESVNITSTSATTKVMSTSGTIIHSSITQPSSVINTRTSVLSSTSVSSVTGSIPSAPGSSSIQMSAAVQMSTFSGMEPIPTSMPLPDSCVENFDPLNSGVYR